MDANPDCKLCGGTGRITHAQAGLPSDPDCVGTALDKVMCWHCATSRDKEACVWGSGDLRARLAATHAEARRLEAERDAARDEVGRLRGELTDPEMLRSARLVLKAALGIDANAMVASIELATRIVAERDAADARAGELRAALAGVLAAHVPCGCEACEHARAVLGDGAEGGEDGP